MASGTIAHAWISSYLTDRKQFITIKGERSKETLKDCDVPQGSILGPNLYEDYTAAPIGDICRRHGVLFHIYADDTQVYLAFPPGEEQSAIEKLECCLHEIKSWMTNNWLQLNDSKTEFIIVGSEKNLSSLSRSNITVGECMIPTSTAVKSIGVVFDCHLKMDK